MNFNIEYPKQFLVDNQKKNVLGLKKTMIYKINLNNNSQKYLEYKDKIDLYDSLKNIAFSTLYEIYKKNLDISSNIDLDHFSPNFGLTIVPNDIRYYECLLFGMDGYIQFIVFLENLSLVCMLIFDYQYIYSCLDNIELNNILNEDYSEIDIFHKKEFKNRMKEKMNEITECLIFLAAKIEEKKCIFFEKKLKELHIKLIQFYKLTEPKVEHFFYQTRFYLKDIDFCLKLFIKILDDFYSNEIIGKIITSFLIVGGDKRIETFLNYDTIQRFRSLDNIFVDKLSVLDNNQMKILNNSLKIKHTLVIGEKNFHNFIKNLNLSTKEFFLQINELNNFCSSLSDFKIDDKYMINKFFVVIEGKNFHEYYKSLVLLSFTYGIIFVIIIYIYDEKNIYINKNIINGQALTPIVVCFSKEDLKDYFNDNEKMESGLFMLYKDAEKTLNSINSFFQIKSENKINSEKLEYDNGWEMVSELNERFFKDLYIINFPGQWPINKLIMKIFELYKEKNNIDLYLKYYCNYFGVNLYNEVSEVLFMKSFIYAYTLDEGDKDKSFYSILNDTLRSGDFEKIKKIIEIFVKFLELIKQKAILSYKGKIYRASFFTDDLLKQIKVDKKMINSALWSTSKDENVAKNFKKNYNKNVIIYTNLNGNFNIDIDEEKLSKFPEEKEVLILPFCIFEVKAFYKVKDSKIGNYYKLDLELIKEYSNLENFKTYTIKMEDLEKIMD